MGTEAHFLDSEAIISLSEDIKDNLKILQFPRKAPAATRQRWDIVTQRLCQVKCVNNL